MANWHRLTHSHGAHRTFSNNHAKTKEFTTGFYSIKRTSSRVAGQPGVLLELRANRMLRNIRKVLRRCELPRQIDEEQAVWPYIKLACDKDVGLQTCSVTSSFASKAHYYSTLSIDPLQLCEQRWHEVIDVVHHLMPTTLSSVRYATPCLDQRARSHWSVHKVYKACSSYNDHD